MISRKGKQEAPELKYNTLAETILDGILVIDFRGMILYGNKAAAKMFGFNEPKEAIGRNIFWFISPGYRTKAIKALVEVYKGNWGFLSSYKVINKNKDSFWVETLGRKVFYQGRSAELFIIRDITERKEMEEALYEAKKDLEKKVEERTHKLKIANEKLKESFKKVERLFNGTIEALASAVKAKDTYTAGHQRRVARLASTIAREMNIPEDRIDGIYMAAVIHDIGKIHVPARVLNKIKPLTKEEFDIINKHARFGYDILKAIEFPWPVAKIVYQHHERINGSGYPLGLSGKDILLEAKILAVADVVEAISCERPYRKALGIETALKEITEKQGVFYDPQVVSACIAVFKNNKFHF